MKLGVNTVDLFSGDHLALTVRSNLHELSLVAQVRLLHQVLLVDYVELPSNLMVICPHLFNEKTIEELRDYQLESGLGYTVHLPFRGLDLSSLSQPVFRASVESFKWIIDRLENALEVDFYVLHLTEAMLPQVLSKRHLSGEVKEKITAKMYAQAKTGVTELLAFAPGEKLLLENIKSGWREPFQIARDLKMGICCDIGHLVLAGEAPEDIIPAYRGSIKEYHLHDVVEWTSKEGDKFLQDHVALGRGLLDLPQLLDLITAESFCGSLTIEVGHWQAALESVQLVREYLKSQLS